MQQSHDVVTQDNDDSMTRTQVTQVPSSPDSIAQAGIEQKSASDSTGSYSHGLKEGNDNTVEMDVSNKSPEERQSLLVRRKNEILKNARRYLNG